jgi:hypothetical protein
MIQPKTELLSCSKNSGVYKNNLKVVTCDKNISQIIEHANLYHLTHVYVCDINLMAILFLLLCWSSLNFKDFTLLTVSTKLSCIANLINHSFNMIDDF